MTDKWQSLPTASPSAGTRGTSPWPPTSTAGPSCWRSAWRRPAGCSGACWTRWPGSSLPTGLIARWATRIPSSTMWPALARHFPGEGAVDKPEEAVQGETCPVYGSAITWDLGSPCADCGHIGVGAVGPSPAPDGQALRPGPVVDQAGHQGQTSQAVQLLAGSTEVGLRACVDGHASCSSKQDQSFTPWV